MDHFRSTKSLEFTFGVVHEGRHGLRVEGSQEICDDSTKAFVIKSMTMGGRGSKTVPNYVTSFINDLL